jgi:hypothetical protein
MAFDDNTIQDVMDEGRLDLMNHPLIPRPTFVTSTVQYLDYFSEVGGWEDDFVLKQYLTIPVTPATSEPIAGHWTFSTTTLPPVFISGKQHDVYRAAADLLERLAAKWMMSYSVSVDGQGLQRNQAHAMMLDLAHQYRMKQRASSVFVTRSDLNSGTTASTDPMAAHAIDFIASGDGR